jgi:hypothetical protein
MTIDKLLGFLGLANDFREFSFDNEILALSFVICVFTQLLKNSAELTIEENEQMNRKRKSES